MKPDFCLQGQHIRLEPLGHQHVDGLAAAAAVDPSLYRWSPVPQGQTEATRYVGTALAWRDAGTAVPFAIIRKHDDEVIGSTRFWNIERWAWPEGHPSHGRGVPDACEIGYTWLARSAVRTAANTEAKLLMLQHAFEVCKCFASAFIPTRGIRDRARRWNASARSLREFCVHIEWRQTSSPATPSAIRSSRQSGRR